MKLNTHFKMASAGLVLALACLLPVPAQTHAVSAITLDPPTGLDLQAHTMDSKGNLLPPAPANFRRLGEAHAGELADLHTLTLRFSQNTRITAISVTKDFKVEQGGSCVTGNVYQKGATCRLLVRFTPQGPGNRRGVLTVANTASATPDGFGLGGYGYSPVISFTPSLITTVPGTYPSNKGLLSGAQNLTIDGGDSLYIADTGNGIIRYIDSSANIKSLASGYSSPLGIAVDTFGDVYFDEPNANIMYEIYNYGLIVSASGTSTGGCTVSLPCTLATHQIYLPAEMSMDPYNHLFFVEETEGAAISTVQPQPGNLIFLYDPFPYQDSPSSAMAVDANDNLYTLWATSGNCEIQQSSLYNAEYDNVFFTKVAGGRTCGFAGDGGLAGNAEIGSTIGQIAFDVAGDLYFSDTVNQRVRRIDFNSGVIRTIAGNGTASYSCDGCGSTVAGLSYPTGVGVDSQGQVYIISGTGTTSGGPQVIRKVTSTGVHYMGSAAIGTHSAPGIVLVTNTGNYPLIETNAVFTGTNPGDFSVDPNTTSCLTPAGDLEEGATCQIGFICTPSAAGLRSAVFTALDNSVNNSNVIDVSCTGTTPPAITRITSPTSGALVTSGSVVSFAVSVTSASGPVPTGTVQFRVDGSNHGAPVTISSGAASTSVTGLSNTSHTLSASYSGDSHYAAGAPVSVTVSVTPPVAHPPIIVQR